MHPERFIAASAIAVIVTMVAIFTLRQLAPRIGLVDKPNDRKRHRGRVPLIGGLCFFLGTLAGLAYFGYMDRFVVCLLAVGALILLTGLLDDLDDLSARTRLIIQAGTAGLVILTTGTYIDGGGTLFNGEEFRLHALGIPVTIIAVVGLINAFNMLDGIDGLAAGLAIVSIVSILAFMGVGWPTVGVALLLQILAATLVPYMCVNLGWPDGRKIFMGDAGSTLIGFLVAWSLIFLSQREAAQLAPVDVLWCVALPVMDTLAVMYRRVRSGRSPLKPDRQHLHHLLLDIGCSSRQALGLLVGLSALMAGAGYALRNAPELVSLVAFASTLVVYVAFSPRIVESLSFASRGSAKAKGLGSLETVAPRQSPSDPEAFPGPALWSGTHSVRVTGEHRIVMRRVAAEGAAHAAASTTSADVVRVLCVLDASPDSLKLAPVVRQLSSDARFELKVCVTALPNQRSRQMLRLFNIRPDHVLDVLAPDKELADMTSAPVRGMKRVLGECEPDVLLVHGDSLTTLAATLAAHFQGVPVACVDGGWSGSGDPDGSEADEAVRKVTRPLVSLHFASTETAARALLDAGVPQERIEVAATAATEVSKSLLAVRQRDIGEREDLARRFSFLRAGSPLLLVAHRPAPEAGVDIGRTLSTLASRRPDLDIVCPVLPAAGPQGPSDPHGDFPNLHLVQPLDYLAFCYLLNAAYLVLAGSREIQQEAALWNKPVLMLRGAAEGPGEARIARADTRSAIDEVKIAECVMTLLGDDRAYEALCFAAGPGGDRNAGLCIVQALANLPRKASSLAA
ncbi:MAG: UDP-N-acetylglucosamine 2-epimerase [Lysobacter sp.]